ncbi:caspase family protein [Methylobacterium aerolatum]|uniref:caspase family protein n=1 Tax=Methylobacterium aerolatum TaxID=418708 RepID=UPI001EE08364|nr:caspase family protein [Methylobacterium aerolatum]
MVVAQIFDHSATAFAQEAIRATPVKLSEAIPSTKRFALVIGNSAYRNVPGLRNTKSDAAAMAVKLRGLGYEVVHATDLDRRSMNETITSFLARIEPGSEVLVYYSGHGVELNGSNYLLPVDIPALSPDQERMLRTEGANLTDLLLDLEGRSPRVTLVILDACRDNPFREANGGATTRSLGATRGLGRVDPPRGTFVIFSAGVGEQAIDNLGSQDTNPNGLFTRKLLPLIGQEGLEIRPMVQRLRAEVREAALSGNGRSQIPSYYDQLLGEFYFRPKSQETEVPTQNSCDRLVDADASATSVLKADLEAGLEACTSAVTQFPSEARFVRQLQAVQEQRMVQRALNSDQADLSRAYLLLYPAGRFAADLRAHIATLGSASETKRAPEQPVNVPVPSPPTPIVVPQVDLGRVLQTELKRVGCDPVSVDGTWGPASTRAMINYNRFTHVSFETAKPTIEALEAVRGHSERICPLVCSRGEHIVSDKCVPITCKFGFRQDSMGLCAKIERPTRKIQEEISNNKVNNNRPTETRRKSNNYRLANNKIKPSGRRLFGDDLTPRKIGGCQYFNGISAC